MQQRYEIVWVEKDEKADPYSRIKRIGIDFASYSAQTVIGYWKSGDAGTWFVKHNGKEYDIVVAETADGRQYLRSSADADIPSSLLNLPGMWEYHDSNPKSPWTSNRSLKKPSQPAV